MRISAVFVVAVISVVPGVFADEPKSTPTPEPTSELAKLAERIRLNEDAVDGESARIVITDEDLLITPDGGAMSTGGRAPKTLQVPSADAAAADASRGTTQSHSDEQDVWKKRLSDLRELEARLVAEEKRLTDELPVLWDRFYREDDPAIREGVLRRKLDAALKRRDEVATRRSEIRGQEQLLFLEAGRAGALPGWFR